MDDRIVLLNALERNAALLEKAWPDRTGKDLTRWMLETCKELAGIESRHTERINLAIDLQKLCRTIIPQDDSDVSKVYGQYSHERFK